MIIVSQDGTYFTAFENDFFAAVEEVERFKNTPYVICIKTPSMEGEGFFGFYDSKEKAQLVLNGLIEAVGSCYSDPLRLALNEDVETKTNGV